MLLVTQSWTAREQHVVVAITAQHIAGRLLASRTAKVICVAGQHIACKAKSRIRVGSGV